MPRTPCGVNCFWAGPSLNCNEVHLIVHGEGSEECLIGCRHYLLDPPKEPDHADGCRNRTVQSTKQPEKAIDG